MGVLKETELCDCSTIMILNKNIKTLFVYSLTSYSSVAVNNCSPSSELSLSLSSSFLSFFTVHGFTQDYDVEHLQNIEQPILAFRHVQFPFPQGLFAIQLQQSNFRTSGGITSTPGGSIVGSNDSSSSFLSKPSSVS